MAKKDKATKKKSVNPGFEEKQVKRQVSLIEEIEETCVEEIQENEDVCVDAIKEDCVEEIQEKEDVCVDAIKEDCVEEIQEKEDVCVDAIKEDCVDAIKEDCVEEIQKKEKTSLITNFKQFIKQKRKIFIDRDRI